jgi:hypothetical protein
VPQLVWWIPQRWTSQWAGRRDTTERCMHHFCVGKQIAPKGPAAGEGYHDITGALTDLLESLIEPIDKDIGEAAWRLRERPQSSTKTTPYTICVQPHRLQQCSMHHASLDCTAVYSGAVEGRMHSKLCCDSGHRGDPCPVLDAFHMRTAAQRWSV